MTPEQSGPGSPIRVAISDRFEFDGIAIMMGLRHSPEDTRIMRINPDGYPSYDIVPPLEVVNPTLRLPHEFARALLDALLRYYQGSGDYHQLRADYTHEQARVDKMLDALMELAANRSHRSPR